MESFYFLTLICSSTVTFIVSAQYDRSPVEVVQRPMAEFQSPSSDSQSFLVANPDPLFVSNFHQALKNAEETEKVFQHFLKATKNRGAFYNTELKYASKFGISEPEGNVQLLIDTLEFVGDALTPSLFSKALLSSIEHYLRDHGILNSENAVELSGNFARDLVNIALVQNGLESPEDYLNAVNELVFNFLSPYQILTPGAADALTKYFVQELQTLKS